MDRASHFFHRLLGAYVMRKVSQSVRSGTAEVSAVDKNVSGIARSCTASRETSRAMDDGTVNNDGRDLRRGKH